MPKVYNTMKKFILLLCLIISSIVSTSQIISVQPELPDNSSTITIIYNAKYGNGELAGYTGTVYAHTGLITDESQNPSDWKHVVGNWGQADNRVKMANIGDDLYSISYNINDFYGLNGSNEKVLQLAFVFRNEDGSLVGRTESNGDIFYSINLDGPGNYISHSVFSHNVEINCDNGQIKISPFSNEIIKLSWIKSGQIEYDTSFSVIMQNQFTGWEVIDNSNSLEIQTDSINVIISKNPIHIEFRRLDEILCSDELGFYSQADNSGLRLKLDENEIIQGTGSRALPINRRGFKLENYNQAHYGYGNGQSNLNISIPLLVSSKSYAVFVDNHSKGSLDIGSTLNNVADISVSNNEISYYFIFSSTSDGLLNNYCKLTGFQPLPPIWAMGYFQSRFGYENESHARSMVSDMLNGDFPLDAIILDLYWFGDPSTMGNLSWDYSKWHNPIKMIYDFKQLGVKTILITEPYITQNSSNYNFANQQQWFAKRENGETYLLDNFWAGQASLLDFTNKESLNWMWNYYSARIDEGVAGWWSDLGEPENHPSDMYHNGGRAEEVHNIYSLLWAQSIFENCKTEKPETRVFNLIRSGYAGMQRYSTFPWSGDIQKTWSGLQAQIPIMLGMSMSGVAYMGSDLGGFTGEFNSELYIRWLEQGCFSPVMRAHGVNTITEPVYLNEPYKSMAREIIKLRYKLLPYNYTLTYDNTLTARPLALPMDYFDKQNTYLQNINDQYFWGEDMLVAPVVEEGAVSRSVIFPKGKWIDFRNNKTYSGERVYNVNAGLGEIPVFVRGGSFIPLCTEISTTYQFNSDTLIVWYYPDNGNAETNFTQYIDDGLSAGAIENNNFELINYHGITAVNTLKINISKQGSGFAGNPDTREMMFEIKRVNNEPVNVLVNSTETDIVSNEQDFLSTPSAAFFLPDEHILKLHFNWDGEETEIEINGSGVGIDESIKPLFVSVKAIPNPFSTRVNIKVNAAKKGNYSFDIFDIYGRKVYAKKATLNFAEQFEFIWDGNSSSNEKLSNGTYILKITKDNVEQQTLKLLLSR